jgi:hypothetical protein
MVCNAMVEDSIDVCFSNPGEFFVDCEGSIPCHGVTGGSSEVWCNANPLTLIEHG